MNKKMLKRSAMLGALMAFVITGNAWAAVEDFDSSRYYWYGTNLIADGIACSEVDGVAVNYSSSDDLTVNIGNDLTETIEFSGKGNKATGLYVNGPHGGPESASDMKVEVVLMASDHINLTADGEESGALWVAGHHSYSKVTIDAPKVYIVSDNNGIFNTGRATIEIDRNVKEPRGLISIKAPKAIVTRWYSNTNINSSGNSTVVIDGDVDFNRYYEDDDIRANVDLKLNDAYSLFTGRIYVSNNPDLSEESKRTAKDMEEEINGKKYTMELELSNGAAWNVTGDSFVNNLILANNGVVNIDGSSKKIDVLRSLKSDDGIVNVADLSNKIVVAENANTNISSLTVKGAQAIADAMTESNKKDTLEKLADVVYKENATGHQFGEYSVATKVYTPEGSVIGETWADVVNGDISNIEEKVHTKNQAVSDAGITLKLHYRYHMNDMNKRMGELRNANGEHGVWTRMVRGECEYENTNAQYNQYQLGYDEKLSIDKRWTVGAAVTFSDGDGNYGFGSTEDKSTAFSIYGSKLNKDGTFVDLIARYAHLESDVDDGNCGKGSYDTNGISVSAEFGRRIQQGNGLWIEPQVELTYGTIDSAEFQLGSKTVHVGEMDSLVGRVGFSIGKDIKQGNVYARASYLYDFDGETENIFSNGTDSRTMAEDLGGSWLEVGVGANINLSKATYIYADVEKSFGGAVDTNWQWNLGVRYSF